MTATDIARAGGMDPNARRRASWERRLRQDPPFTEYDAIATAVAAELSRFNHRNAGDVFDRVAPQLRDHVLRQADDLWIVSHGGFSELVEGAANAATVADRKLNVQILSVREAVASARSRYAELLDRGSSGAGAQVRSITQQRGAS